MRNRRGRYIIYGGVGLASQGLAVAWHVYQKARHGDVGQTVDFPR